MKGISLFIILIIALSAFDIITSKSALLLLAAGLIILLLLVAGRLRAVFLFLALFSTGLMIWLFRMTSEYKLLGAGHELVFVVMWTLIIYLFLEYFILSADLRFEKIDIYRKYLFLNMLQTFIIMSSMFLVIVGPQMASAPGFRQPVILDLITLVIIAFIAASVSFAIFIVKNVSSARFMADFAQSLAGLSAGGDTGVSDKESLKNYKRMRFISYMLFIFSLAAVYFVSKSRLIDAYAVIMSERNSFIGFLVMLMKGGEVPPWLGVIMKLGLLAVDIYIIKEIYEFLSRKEIIRLWTKALKKLGITFTAPAVSGSSSEAGGKDENESGNK